jgi:hypothetical protein
VCDSFGQVLFQKKHTKQSQIGLESGSRLCSSNKVQRQAATAAPQQKNHTTGNLPTFRIVLVLFGFWVVIAHAKGMCVVYELIIEEWYYNLLK